MDIEEVGAEEMDLDHIDIVVEDLTASTRFFEMLGFTIVPRTDRPEGDMELKFPGSSGIILELKASQRMDGTVWPVGLRHMALRCADIDAASKTLAAAGVAFDAPPKFVKNSGRMVTNALGPNGTLLQIVS